MLLEGQHLRVCIIIGEHGFTTFHLSMVGYHGVLNALFSTNATHHPSNSGCDESNYANWHSFIGNAVAKHFVSERAVMFELYTRKRCSRSSALCRRLPALMLITENGFRVTWGFGTWRQPMYCSYWETQIIKDLMAS